MVLNRLIGIGMMVIGVFITSYHFMAWQMARSAAEEMTEAEVQQYTQEVKPVQKNSEDADNAAKVRTEGKPEPQQASTEVQHELGEKVAWLIVPGIAQKYSVYWGAQPDILKKGVGMYVSPFTTAPNGGGHTVLSGHRDTVFYRLKELEEGDVLKVEYHDDIYTYKINKIWITHAEDRSVVVRKSIPTLTLTTCYPFSYIGNAPKRYIVQAELVK
ncbi:class D sortase [Mesobacillus foraminis]|uniref:class D sortase n=1 Tax=Mesobacillus foraminis TaxID=279826 RepID=UPI0010483383|nr:class D sortase [Mesobacillus foraminis]